MSGDIGGLRRGAQVEGKMKAELAGCERGAKRRGERCPTVE